MLLQTYSVYFIRYTDGIVVKNGVLDLCSRSESDIKSDSLGLSLHSSEVMQTRMLISMMSIVDPGSEVIDGCTVVTVSKMTLTRQLSP